MTTTNDTNWTKLTTFQEICAALGRGDEVEYGHGYYVKGWYPLNEKAIGALHKCSAWEWRCRPNLPAPGEDCSLEQAKAAWDAGKMIEFKTPISSNWNTLSQSEHDAPGMGKVDKDCAWRIAPEQPDPEPDTEPKKTTAACTLRFADIMEQKLSRNRHKGNRDGWLNCTADLLFEMLEREVEELRQSVVDLSHGENVAGEAADVANFAMMIADVRGGLFPAEDIRRRIAPDQPAPVAGPAPKSKMRKVPLEAKDVPLIPAASMTLRDAFAGSVIGGIYYEYSKPGKFDIGWRSELAKDAYRLADAMMSARTEVEG